MLTAHSNTKQHNFVNGLDYYGSFLGLKNNFSVNVIDDLEYLAESDYFNKNNNKLFTISDVFNEEVINSISRNYKKRLQVSSEKSNLSLDSIESFINNTEEVFSVSPKVTVFSMDSDIDDNMSDVSSDTSSVFSE